MQKQKSRARCVRFGAACSGRRANGFGGSPKPRWNTYPPSKVETPAMTEREIAQPIITFATDDGRPITLPLAIAGQILPLDPPAGWRGDIAGLGQRGGSTPCRPGDAVRPDFMPTNYSNETPSRWKGSAWAMKMPGQAFSLSTDHQGPGQSNCSRRLQAPGEGASTVA